MHIRVQTQQVDLSRDCPSPPAPPRFHLLIWRKRERVYGPCAYNQLATHALCVRALLCNEHSTLREMQFALSLESEREDEKARDVLKWLDDFTTSNLSRASALAESVNQVFFFLNEQSCKLNLLYHTLGHVYEYNLIVFANICAALVRAPTMRVHFKWCNLNWLCSNRKTMRVCDNCCITFYMWYMEACSNVVIYKSANISRIKTHNRTSWLQSEALSLTLALYIFTVCWSIWSNF